MNADISFFESLYNNEAVVFNSAASLIMKSYDRYKNGGKFCKKFIDELDSEDYIPAELISSLYTLSEKFEEDTLKTMQEAMDQASKEPLDNFDRKIYLTLSSESQEDLRGILEADEVFRRALELKDDNGKDEEADINGDEEDINDLELDLDEEDKDKESDKPKEDNDKNELDLTGLTSEE